MNTQPRKFYEVDGMMESHVNMTPSTPSPVGTGTGYTRLFELLAEHGGTIESTASLNTYNINQARASGRLYVDENSLGFVWMPKSEFPTTEDAVENFEKWFPLEIELPESLRNTDFLFDKLHRKSKITERDIFEALKSLPSAAPQDADQKGEGWIRCEDGLPDKNIHCLVFDSYWGIIVRPYNDYHKCWDGEDADDYYTDAVGGKITHWQPLPSPPSQPGEQC